MDNETFQSTIPLPPHENGEETLRSSGLAGLSQREDEVKRRIISARETYARSVATGNEIEHPEFLIPVRLSVIQRRIYRSLILEHAVALESFCQNPSNELRSELENLVKSLNTSTTHPFLLASVMSSNQLSETDEAWYIIQASSKFEVLIELIEALRHQAVRVVILSKGPKVSGLLQTICKGLHIRYTQIVRDDESVNMDDNCVGDFELVILPIDVPLIAPGHVDLCVTFDNEGTFAYAPMIRLIAKNTAEHVLCQKSEDMVTIMSTIANLCPIAGFCSHDAGEIAQKLVQFVCGQPLELEMLPDLTFPSSQYDAMSYTASNGDQDQPSPSKRRRIEHSGEQLPGIIITKIDGIEVHTEAQIKSPDNFHLHDMTGTRPSNVIDDPSFSLHESHSQDLVFDIAMSQGEQLQQAQCIAPIHLEKTPTQEYKQTRSEIWTQQTPDQGRIATLEADLERTMLRFDDLREECRAYSEQKEEALQRASSLQKRFERITDEARASRLEKNELKMELDRMRMPPLPEEDSPDYFRAESIRLRTELEKSKKSSDSKTQDFEFVRQQYQQSSNAAATLAVENEALQTEVASLKNKIESGMGYRMVVLRSQTEIRALREEVENVTLRNNVLIEQLRRMRDEKLAGRGREGRREVALQDRKRAASASDIGHRKKVEKIGTSRLSVASLISHASVENEPSADHGHIMLRGQSHDSRAYGRERGLPLSVKRDRTPFGGASTDER